MKVQPIVFQQGKLMLGANMNLLRQLNFLFLILFASSCMEAVKKSNVEFNDSRSPSQVKFQELMISSPSAYSTFHTALILKGYCQFGMSVQIYHLGKIVDTHECQKEQKFSTTIRPEGPDGVVTIDFYQVEPRSGEVLSRVSIAFTKSSVNTFDPALSVLANNCLNCHGVNSGSLNFDFTSEQDFIDKGWVVPGSEELSKLTNRTKHFQGVTTASPGAQNMPMGSAYKDFKRDEYNILRDWVVSLQTRVNPVNIVTPLEQASVVSTVLVSGTCDSEYDVIISLDQSSVATLSCSGTFERLISVPGVDGVKVISVVQYDEDNQMIGSDSVSVKKDTLSVANVEIVAPDSMATFQQNLLLEGNCSSGLNLRLSIDGEEISTNQLTCSSGGDFQQQVSLPGLDGQKNILVEQLDQFGNILGSNNRIFLKDNVAPELSISMPDAGTAGLSGLTMSGTCETNAPVSFSGSGLSNPSSFVCMNSNWSYTALFSSGLGTKNIVVSSSDRAGNSIQISRTFTRVQTLAQPVLEIATPLSLFRTQEDVVLTGLCTPEINITFSGDITNDSSLCPQSGTFEKLVKLLGNDGEKTIRIRQTVNGSILEDSLVVVRDNAPPVIQITSHQNNQEVFESIIIQGICEMNASNVVISSDFFNTQSVPCNGSFSVNLSLSGDEGAKDIFFSQTDSAFNTSSLLLSLNYIIPPPDVQRFLRAKNVIIQSCVGCHASSGNKNFNLATEEEFVLAGHVKPGNINESPITYRTKWHNNSTDPNSNQNMPSGTSYGSFPQQSYEILKDWVENMKSYTNTSGLSRFHSPRIATRKYTKSVLSEVFGPSVEETLNELILANSSTFSGPCDRYETGLLQNPARRYETIPAVEKDSCFSGTGDIDLQVIGNSNILRAGWTIKVPVKN